MLRHLAVASLLLAAVADVVPGGLKKKLKKLKAKEAAASAARALEAAHAGVDAAAPDGRRLEEDDDDVMFATWDATCSAMYDWKTCFSTECGLTITDDGDDDDDDDDDDGDDDDYPIATCADAEASPAFLEACDTTDVDSVCAACSPLYEAYAACVMSMAATFELGETCAFVCPADTTSAAAGRGAVGVAAFGLCLAAGAL